MTVSSSKSVIATAVSMCAAAFALQSASTAQAAVDPYSYTFTSGGNADGVNWPRSQRSSQAPGGGLEGGPFFPGDGSGLSFYNFSGNPAYYDGSNLLTRPAALINNEAWWTDPRTANYVSTDGQTYQSASIAVAFDNDYIGPVSQFGFDLAIASVSNPVPASINFHALDTLGEMIFGTLHLDPAAPPENGVSSDLHGTFLSMNSVYQGHEARFSIDIPSLLSSIRPEESEGVDLTNYGLDLFVIEMEPFTTLGGTTQLAIDNFVINGGAPGEPTREPIYIPASGPVPDETTYLFTYVEGAPEEPNETTIDPSQFGDDDLAAVSVHTQGVGDDDLSARASTTDTTIVFPAEQAGVEILSHEVTHVSQGSSQQEGQIQQINTLFTSATGANEIEVMTSIVNVVTSENAGPIDNFLVEIRTLLGSEAISVGAVFAESIAAGQQEILIDIDDLTEIAFIRAESISGSQGALSEAVLATLADGAEFYLNYTFLEYIAHKESVGEEWVVGDQGATIVPVLGGDGEIASYMLTNWIVANDSGSFTQILVPEPTGVIAVIGLGALFMRRRS
jgi:hypothetical protein